MDGQPEPLSYTIRRSARAKRASLSVRDGGKIVVVAPPRIGEKALERFVSASMGWIAGVIARQQQLPQPTVLSGTRKDLVRLAPQARQLVGERLHHFNQQYGFAIGSIIIRDQKSRWGSCAKGGKLSFNYRLALLPPELADYVIVHELCHIGQMNHSAAFWQLVALAIPDWRRRRDTLNAKWRIA